jgi:hypothetical protein
MFVGEDDDLHAIAQAQLHQHARDVGLDAFERLALACLVLMEQPPHGTRLQDHHGHAVRDRVVELAGDPRALVGPGRPGLLLGAGGLAFGLHAACLVAVHHAPGAPGEQVEPGLRARLLPFASGTGLVPAVAGASIMLGLFGSIGVRVARMSDQAWAERAARSVTSRLKAPKIALESAA